jgi:hypothetical protein
METNKLLVFSYISEINLINLALGKPATQSSTSHTAPARRAVDGNKNSNFTKYSCTHTYTTTSPWWRVDLQNVVGIFL